MNARAIAKYSFLAYVVLFLLLNVPVYTVGCISAPFGYVDCQFRGTDISDAMSGYSWFFAIPSFFAIMSFCVSLIFLLSKLFKTKFKNYLASKQLNDT